MEEALLAKLERLRTIVKPDPKPKKESGYNPRLEIFHAHNAPVSVHSSAVNIYTDNEARFLEDNVIDTDEDPHPVLHYQRN